MAGCGLLIRVVCLLGFVFGISVPAFAAGAAYSTYSFNGTHQIDVTNCGTTGTVHGCFGPGASLNGLDGACSILEGPPTTKGNLTTQLIYVLQTGSDADPVVRLKVYKKNITIQPNNIVLAIALQRSVNILSLTGGSNLTCSMAANSTSIFLGTSTGTHAVQLNKKNFVGRPFGKSLPPERLTGITASEEGYVTVYFGGKGGASFYLFGPNGQSVEFGGAGNPVFVPNQTNGVKLK